MADLRAFFRSGDGSSPRFPSGVGLASTLVYARGSAHRNRSSRTTGRMRVSFTLASARIFKIPNKTVLFAPKTNLVHTCKTYANKMCTTFSFGRRRRQETLTDPHLPSPIFHPHSSLTDAGRSAFGVRRSMWFDVFGGCSVYTPQNPKNPINTRVFALKQSRLHVYFLTQKKCAAGPVQLGSAAVSLASSAPNQAIRHTNLFN